MISLVILTLLLIVGSALCSGCEAAVFTVSKIRAQSLAAGGSTAAQNLLQIKENISPAIGTLVILSNLLNIIGSIFVGVIATALLGDIGLGIYSVIFTILIIIFGEVIPKNFGEKNAEPMALTIAGPVLVLSRVFRPILYVLDRISGLAVGQKVKSFVSEDEIKFMADLGLKEQSIEQDEQQLIQNVFKMNDKSASSIMTPRVHIDALEISKTLDEQKEEIYRTPHSRLPVYGEDYDEILGFVLLREILQALSEGKAAMSPSDFLHPVIAVKENTRVDHLLIMFQKKRTHIAIVVDDFGGTSGLVTLEDVLEELVGEIVDETDEVVDMRALRLSNPNVPARI